MAGEDLLCGDKGKKLWNSEYGEGASGNRSRPTSTDFRWLHPTAWVPSQADPSGGWGLLKMDAASGSWPRQQQVVVLANTRVTCVAVSIIDGGEDNTVAAVVQVGSSC